MSVIRCWVEVSAKDRSLIQRSPTECGVSVIVEPYREGLGSLELSSYKKNSVILIY